MAQIRVQLKEIDYDDVMNDVDPTGTCRKKNVILTLISAIIACISIADYVFVTKNLPYRCKVSTCDIEGDFRPFWLNNSIPYDNSCMMYERTNFSVNANHSMTCPAEWFDNTTLIPCKEYVYEFEKSFVEEMKIPCENWKRTFVGTLQQLGMLSALPISGFISDRYGRKKAFMTNILFYMIFGLAKTFLTTYELYIIIDLIAATLGTGAFTCCYVLVLESLPTKYRVVGTAIVPMMFSFGQIIKGVLAWLIPYWRNYLRISYSIYIVLFANIWLMEESYRWILSKRDYRKFKEVIECIAQKNGKRLSTSTEYTLNFNIEHSKEKHDDQDSQSKTSPYLQVLRSKKLVGQTLAFCILWITCNFCTYGFAVYSVEMGGNIYVNFISIQTVTAFSFGLGAIVMHFFKRKIALSMSFLMSCIMSVIYIYLPEGNWLSLMTYLGAVMFLMLSFDVLYMLTSEVYPTTLRQSMLGFCSMVGKSGSLLSPQVPLLAIYMKELPMLMFASTCLISSILTFVFPETSNKKLPETIEDSKNITRGK